MSPERRDSSLEPFHIKDFSGGFHDRVIPTNLRDNQATDTNDTLCTPRGLFQRPGADVIFTKPTGTDPVIGLFSKFRRSDDITELWRWDKLRMHKFGTTQWDEITVLDLVTNGGFDADTDWNKGAGWTIAAGVASAAAASSNLDQTIPIVEGKSYEVVLDLSNFAAGTVTPTLGGTAGTARSTNATHTETIVAGSSGLIEMVGAAFTGDVDNVTVTQVTDASFGGTNSDFFTAQNFGNKVYFSNGVDDIQSHVFGTLERRAVHKDAPNCRYMTRFAERIFCGYVDGSNKRIQWHVRGDADDWNGTGSGSLQLKLLQGEITQMSVLPDRLVVYEDSGIVLGTETGDVNNPVEYAPLPGEGVGLYAPLTLANLGRRHLFLGREPGQGFSVYEFSLERGIRDIGDEVRRFINDTVDIATIEKSHASYDPQTRCYVLWLQGTGSPSVKGLAFQLETETWGAKWTRPQSTSVPTFSHAALKDASGFARGEFLFIGNSTGDVMRYNPTALNDGGSDAISAVWESKDFQIEDNRFDIQGVDVIVATRGGDDIKISSSHDGGATFGTDQVFTFAAAGTREQLQTAQAVFDKSGKTFRFRVTNDAAGEGLDIREATVIVHSAPRTRPDNT